MQRTHTVRHLNSGTATRRVSRSSAILYTVSSKSLIYYGDNLLILSCLFSQNSSADKDNQSSNPEISISIEDCAEQTGPDIKLDR